MTAPSSGNTKTVAINPTLIPPPGMLSAPLTQDMKRSAVEAELLLNQLNVQLEGVRRNCPHPQMWISARTATLRTRDNAWRVTKLENTYWGQPAIGTCQQCGDQVSCCPLCGSKTASQELYDYTRVATESPSLLEEKLLNSLFNKVDRPHTSYYRYGSQGELSLHQAGCDSCCATFYGYRLVKNPYEH